MEKQQKRKGCAAPDALVVGEMGGAEYKATGTNDAQSGAVPKAAAGSVEHAASKANTAHSGDPRGGAPVAQKAGSEPLSLSDLRFTGKGGVFGSSPLMSALAFGLYMSWVYLACFSTKLYPEFGATAGLAAQGELASFAGYLAWIAVCVATYRRLSQRWGSRVLVVGVLASAGTACIAAASLFAAPQVAQVLVMGASVVTGLGTGCLMVAWALQFARNGAHASVQVGGGLVLSFAVTCAALPLPFELAAGAIMLLPAASAMAIVRATDLADADPDVTPAPTAPADAAFLRLPWRLALGLSAMGLAYGMAYGFAFEYAQTGIEVSIACLLVNGAIGAVVLVYALRFGKNFGYSAANLAILPIAGFAQCMIAVLRVQLLPGSFFCMRLAYVLFDVVLWLQLPKVFGHIGTIRTFLVARLFLEGSVAVGIVVREALTHTGFLVFDLVALAVVAYLLVALTLALRGGAVGSVWDLMPEPLTYTGKFRTACAAIAERYGLTPREAEVMRLVMRGRSGAYVQENLFISKSTFQTHMRNLYKKLDVHTNQELLDLLEATLDEQRAGQVKRMVSDMSDA